jgi:hypothetical protein
VQLLFEHGASLRDSEGLLHGRGTQTRTIDVRSEDSETKKVIVTFVQEAVAQRLLLR